MSSLFVQGTVVPTGTVIACGPKTKLSIFTATFAAEGWALAVTRDDPANSSSVAIITGITTLAIRTLFFVICLSPYILFSCLNPEVYACGFRSLLYYQHSFHISMAYATDIRAAKLESASLVSSEFDDDRRSLRNFLVDVKVVQFESVIVVRCGHD